MKLILAIVNNDDSHTLSNGLTRAHFFVTKLATTGGFLMAGNTTFLIGTEDEKVDEVLNIIARYSRKSDRTSACRFGLRYRYVRHRFNAGRSDCRRGDCFCSAC